MDESTDLENKGRILVVDDNPADLSFLKNVFRAKGYQVNLAREGQNALQFVRSTIPDLVLLDVNMPGIDGYQVCEYLKADEKTRDIPIIFLSGANQVLDKVKGFSKGGVDY